MKQPTDFTDNTDVVRSWRSWCQHRFVRVTRVIRGQLLQTIELLAKDMISYNPALTADVSPKERGEAFQNTFSNCERGAVCYVPVAELLEIGPPRSG